MDRRAETPRSGALDLHEGISPGRSESAVDGTSFFAPLPAAEHADPAAQGCPRWPETLRLRSSLGELVRGRCRATNLCAYCARLSAVETAEMLALDAVHGEAPALWCVLTTRTATLDVRRFYKSRELVMRDMRARWPGSEAAWVVEFTTGYGPRSGGARRPHWNVLVKGLVAGELDELHELVTARWCSREDAQPRAQFVGPVAEVGGLMRYLALHFLKESQQPPPGWRGHRFTASRGYLWTSTPLARQAARDSLREKRAVYRAIAQGCTGYDAELAAQRALELQRLTSWQLVNVVPSGAPATLAT